MMDLETYFNNILATEGYDAWEEANAELIALVEAEEAAWLNDEELDLTTGWAEAHNIDLLAGQILLSGFVTYFQSWYWDNFED
jgi:hypothetical protein